MSTPEDKTDADAIEEETTEVADSETDSTVAESKTEVAPTDKRGINWARVLAFGVLPVVALLLGAGALALLAIGNRRGLREPVFQLGVGALTVFAILMPLILMKVAGGTTV